MKRVLLLAAALLALSGMSWSATITYDGSSDPTTLTPAWFLYEGAIQGSPSDEGGGNYSWYLNDASDKKTKLAYSSKNGIDVNVDTGAYIESRVKCTEISDPNGNALNLGIYVKNSTKADLTVRPNTLLFCGTTYDPGVTGTFSNYHILRMVYKKLDLRARGLRQNCWALYMDGSSTPLLYSTIGNGIAAAGGPLWGSGNTSPSQKIYFDYVNYCDDAALVPGADGTVTFANGDPDAISAGTSGLTFSWQTNAPTNGVIYYSKVGTGAKFALTASDTGGLKASHSVTVTSLDAPADYEYYVVSTDAGGKKAISLPMIVTLNPFNFSSAPTATVPNATTANISFQTSLTDTLSEVQYGLWPGCIDNAKEPGAGGITNHQVSLSVTPGNLYYYYAHSVNAQWGDIWSGSVNDATRLQSFTTSLPGDEYLDNVGFEILDTPENAAKKVTQRDISPWVRFGTFDGVYRMFEWNMLPKLAYCAGSVGHYTNPGNMGGIYQSIPTTPGQYYEAKVLIWTRRQSGPTEDPPGSGIYVPTTDPSKPLDVACRIGIDPTGGTSPGQFNAETGVWEDNPNIAWSLWSETSQSCTDNETGGSGGPWEQISMRVKTIGPSATIFMQQQQRFPLVWNVSAFDDAGWNTLDWTAPSTIAGTKDLPQNYPADLTGKIVTASWPAENRFCIEEPDKSSAIWVKTTNSAPVPPVGSSASLVGYKSVNASGEPEIVAWTVTDGGPANGAKPIAMSNKSIGRVNSAMLTTIYGRVLDNPDMPGCPEYVTSNDPTAVNYDPYGRYYIYIDDGSGVDADYKLQWNEPAQQWSNTGRYKGVKVCYHGDDYLPTAGEYIVCTGIAGIETSDGNFTDSGGDIATVRTLELRSAALVSTETNPQDYTDVLIYPGQ